VPSLNVVPISVVAGFKKIKALVQSNSMLASALRTSSKLVSSMIIQLGSYT
jgi:La-related protein 7